MRPFQPHLPLRRSAVAVSITLLLNACVANPPILTAADVQSAAASDQLELLYQELATASGRGKGMSQKERDKWLADIGRQLAQQRLAELSRRTDSARTLGGWVPLDTLATIEKDARELRKMDGKAFAEFIPTVEAERRKSQRAIEGLEKVVAESQNLGEQLDALANIEILKGEGSAAQLQQTRESLLAATYTRIGKAAEKRQYAAALSWLEQIHSVEPGYKDVAAQLTVVSEKAAAQTLQKKLDAGDIDGAYQSYLAYRQTPHFHQPEGDLRPLLEGLVEFYDESALSAMADDNIARAFELLQHSKTIASSLLGGDAPFSDAPFSRAEDQFVEILYQRFESAELAGKHGLAYGYLLTLQEFDSKFPGLQKALRETREKVLNSSVIRLASTTFEHTDKQSHLGKAISNKVIQHIFAALPKEVRIVERENLNDVLREQEINALAEGSGVKITSADYLIQGAVLEASVESTEKTGRKVQRVVTGRKNIANPEHSQWVAENGKSRNIPEPPKTIEEKIQEDVAINVTLHRKVGVLALSYRIVDAHSAKLLYTNSVRDKVSVSDESQEGIQLGEFSTPFKIAELPSDSELLTELATTLSAQVSDAVITRLKDPELRYQKAARRSRYEEDYMSAAEEMAKVSVLMEEKSLDVSEAQQELKQLALQSSFSG